MYFYDKIIIECLSTAIFEKKRADPKHRSPSYAFYFASLKTNIYNHFYRNNLQRINKKTNQNHIVKRRYWMLNCEHSDKHNDYLRTWKQIENIISIHRELSPFVRYKKKQFEWVLLLKCAITFNRPREIERDT